MDLVQLVAIYIGQAEPVHQSCILISIFRASLNLISAVLWDVRHRWAGPHGLLGGWKRRDLGEERPSGEGWGQDRRATEVFWAKDGG